MSFTGVASIDHSIDSTNVWLSDIAKEIGTEDRRVAYQVLRGWLHTLRDRLTVEVAAHFAAQLPEVLRGIFFDGWNPSKVPVKYGADEFAARFAREANLQDTDVLAPLAAVTTCARRHMTDGVVDHALGQLPPAVRAQLDQPVEVVQTETGGPA